MRELHSNQVLSERLAGNEQTAQQAGQLVLLADRELADEILLGLALRARRSPPRLIAPPRQSDVDKASVTRVVASGDITAGEGLRNSACYGGLLPGAVRLPDASLPRSA
jgi:hypothetical protein